MPEILVDQLVAKKYFEKEIDFFKRYPDKVKERGWKVERMEFPFFEISLYHKNFQLKYLTLRFDLKNYNILPISVEIIYPKIKIVLGVMIGVEDKHRRLVIIEGNNVLLSHYKLKRPFICMKGTYEYHIHSQHEKTYWDVFRYRHIGYLYYLVNTIWEGSTKRIHIFFQKKTILIPEIYPLLYFEPVIS